MNKIMTLLIICFLIPTLGTQAATRKKKENKTEQKKQSEYDKLFNTPACKTVKGLITLHKIDGKVYFEFPFSLFGKEMLLGSTVEEISDNTEALVGQKPHRPLHIYFTKIDTNVQMRYVYNASVTNAKDKNIQEAIDKGNIGAIAKMFPVKCWNNDKSAVVFDVTDFLVSDLYEIDPFDPYSASTYGGWIQRITNFKKDRSFIGDIMAFEDNVSISSHLSFGVTMRALGMFEYQTDKPFSALVKRSLILLPEKPMQPRILDPRIGVFYTGKMKFTNDDNGSDVVYYAHRWRVEPKDMEAYKRGELVDVKQPIIFYIDPNFPQMWMKYIRMGVEDWNRAFEEIGLKNVVQTKMFPVDDPEFDPNNIKYTCIRYAPIPVENAMGPSWVDPRSGEILNASVYIYHNLVSLLYTWRMLQTAAVDPSVRQITLPEEVMGDAIRYVARHEVGHCFGLMHNMASSNAFPTDSLRSATFTQKYGTTPSIMDDARFNYVAQPGDLEKGVKLTPPIIGQYDYYAIKWIYKPIPEAKTAEEEVPTLDRWISEKAGDPIYRYGKQQIMSRYDPSALEEDLGDDAIKSATYGLKNLRYVMENLNEWVAASDTDLSFRNQMYYAILNQFRTYMGHVTPIIGGIYLNEKYEGDPRPTYQSVPKAEQKRALQFLLQLQEDMSWLDNKEMLKNIPIIGNPGVLFQQTLISNLISNASGLGLCISKSEDPYTEEEYLQDIYDYIWKPTQKGVTLKSREREAQLTFVKSLIKESKLDAGKGKARGSMNITDNLTLDQWLDQKMFQLYGYVPEQAKLSADSPEPVQGVGFQRRVKAEFPSIAHVYYNVLMKTKQQLEKAKNTGNTETRNHYALLLHQINQALKKD